ncbi:hypothetical protein ACEPAI_8017 [Sanghuangporus weigelae]
MTPFRTLSVLVLACLLAVNVQASLAFDEPPANLAHLTSHRRLAQRRSAANSVSPAKVRRQTKDSRRCKDRDASSGPVSSSTAVSTSTSSTWSEAPTPDQPQAQPEQNNNPPAPEHAKPVNANVIPGLINVQSNCGDIGATREITATSGPNGNIDWLNCGLTGNGWNPPYISIDNLVTADLNTDGPFAACSDFIGLFYQYGQQFNIPPIMLAAFAMQESSCRPDTVGGAGEQGLMQLTRDKCGGAPGGNCKDPDFNIRTGAKYIADTLSANNGDVLLTIGQYNGWTRGLTYDRATAAANTNCCRCQNNCDYLHQFVNGWLQNIDAYTFNPPLGKFFNLNVCH